MVFQDDAELKKARGAELEYESLKVNRRILNIFITFIDSLISTHVLVFMSSSHANALTRQRQELESENKKLKHNLAEMRQSLLRDASASAGAPGSPAYKVLLEQLTASCEELDVRKEEVLILRSQLVSQKEAMQHKVEEFTSCVVPPVCEHLKTVVCCCCAAG